VLNFNISNLNGLNGLSLYSLKDNWNMPRKKIAKRANPRQMNNNLTTLQKMENDFWATPAKLAAQLNKEISVSKQNENKIKNEVKKCQQQLKSADASIKAAAKVKTVAGKKQLVRAKKLYKLAVQEFANLNKQCNEATKSLHQLMQKQLKLIALSKYLKQFDKEWIKNSKTKTKAKVKSRRRIKQEIQHPKVISNIQELPHIETSEIRVDNKDHLSDASEDLELAS
jgi:hypothetical protein